MPKLFISYRRDDSSDVTGRLHDRLKDHFGREAVFLDIDAIPLGVDFRKYLADEVNQCDVLLAVIGDHWLDASYHDGPNAGQRRLDDPHDYVRIEVEAALAVQGAAAVVVLVRGIQAAPLAILLRPCPRQLRLPQPLLHPSHQGRHGVAVRRSSHHRPRAVEIRS